MKNLGCSVSVQILPKILIEKARANISVQKANFTTILKEPQSGVYLFFSFDLVNSTQFKAQHPSNWPIVVTRFYDFILEMLTTRLSSAIVWKFVGDEVLFYKKIAKNTDLHSALPAAYDALRATTELLHNNFPESRELLAVKGTVWIAEAEPVQPSAADKIEVSCRNIIVETGRYPSNVTRDFLGPEIDIGFRISKFALRQRLVVSAELACLLFRENKIGDQLRVVSFETLKGVWGGRHYPIVWYEKDWKKIAETFLFDEHLISELAAKVKQGLNDDALLKIVEKVFADLGRTEEVNRLVAAVEKAYKQIQSGPIEIEIPKDRYAEIHCVAICFSPDGQVLAARRPTTKRRFPDALEFGCGQLRLGESFNDCLRRAYKDDFGVDLKLRDHAVPVRTFAIHDEDEEREIPGIIFIAEILDMEIVMRNFSREKHSEVLWINPDNFKYSDHVCVPDFEVTLRAAVEIWGKLNAETVGH